MRAVLDSNVLIASLLSRSGAPAQIVSRWLAGEFELVVSEALLAELARALAYPKVHKRVAEDEARHLSSFCARQYGSRPTPSRQRAAPPIRATTTCSRSPRRSALSLSGDQHLLALARELPVLTPRAFLETLTRA